LEFGARATGKPTQAIPVQCDMEGALDGITFSRAHPVVMNTGGAAGYPKR
jgi:hypothetical protein